jgi:hypothetical protein
MGSKLIFALGEKVKIDYSAIKAKSDGATLQTVVEYDKSTTKYVDVLTYLTGKNSFRPQDSLFDFTVDERLIGKSLALTFTSTDGLTSLKKQVEMLFVRARAIN